jgi:hypothetical protein
MTLRMGEPYVDQRGGLTQTGWQAFTAMEERIADLEAKLAAAAAVSDATGGATIDAEARAELIAIKGALA